MQSIMTLVTGLLISFSCWADNVRLDIPSKEIASVSFNEKNVQVILTPEARASFEKFTQDNLNKTLNLSIEGVRAQRATIHSVVTSGLLRVDKPSEQLMEILRGLPQKEF
ncbi:hypothetical protein [Vibrio ishigakensis]|uniref:hypothetical protein n=1 Tax=Vibrio ishigakensis TaxID=1481914 RepID=UPI0021C2A7D0|nr:hypothetical protein [Vibrio ishigakensis]